MKPSPKSPVAPLALPLLPVWVVALFLVLTGSWTTPAAAMLGSTRLVEFGNGPGRLPLVAGHQAVPILVAAEEYAGVARAAADLTRDVERVTGVLPALLRSAPNSAKGAVIVGTIGRHGLIDRLVAAGKIDVFDIRGKWEAFVTQVVDEPLPGINRALVIAGSDKRGTIFGVYELSTQLGVSPWYWWADVPAASHDAVFANPVRVVESGPKVKYRGLFLNDEAPDLTNWVRAKFGDAAISQRPPVPAGIANYGREFYARMFEVMLRLRANYLWPAMWNNAFNEDDPANAALADEYGIVMGTSHQEPMLRAQKEWDRRFEATLGHWNYAKHPEVLQDFWREGIRRNRNFESLITLGLRGANDTEMAPGGPAANSALLEQIVATQREILRAEINPDVTQVPQLWCLYKEVQDFYEHGLRVPDDVTLLWAEDNWGNLRRVPTAAERARSGGAGIYYHFDYHGGPRSYQWLNTSPIAKIQEQMSLAARYGADRIWIVNAGHFKGYEFPLEYFLTLAWAPEKWAGEDVARYTRAWAAREFGEAHAGEIAEIIAGYTKFNGRRKPEMLAANTYSLVNYGEAERVVDEFDALVSQAEAIARKLTPAQQDAFYGLVYFPTKASALVNELYLAAAKNALYAGQGRASANAWAAETRKLFEADVALMEHFNRQYAGGKWAHFMDQPHLGYLNWRDPPENSLRAIPLVERAVPSAPALGVAIEGAESAWPGATGEARLPRFDPLNRQRRYVEVFNRGGAPFAFTATVTAPWIRLSETAGEIGEDRRLWVDLDWEKVPVTGATGDLVITGAGETVRVTVEAFRPAINSIAEVRGFVEDAGMISIEAEHFHRQTEQGENRWVRIADYGRTLSGLRAETPLDAPAAKPGADAACLEYEVEVFEAGSADVTVIVGPTLNILPNRGLSYAVAFDEQPPQMITLVPRGYQASNRNADWEKVVGDNARYSTSAHQLATSGRHTLKIWMIDPGVVLQKIVIDLGGLRPSYLGPPESRRFGEDKQSTVGPGFNSSTPAAHPPSTTP